MGKEQILTSRFTLRPISVQDVNDRYVNWLQEMAGLGFIISASATTDLATLRTYVAKRVGRPDIIFLGIFEKISGLHIGNIKYEPIDREAQTATMGILIGDPNWRGAGVASEVLLATARLLREKRDTRKILLGVNRLNKPAIRAYLKIGFKKSPEHTHAAIPPKTINMAWDLESDPRFRVP